MQKESLLGAPSDENLRRPAWPLGAPCVRPPHPAGSPIGAMRSDTEAPYPGPLCGSGSSLVAARTESGPDCGSGPLRRAHGHAGKRRGDPAAATRSPVSHSAFRPVVLPGDTRSTVQHQTRSTTSTSKFSGAVPSMKPTTPAGQAHRHGESRRPSCVFVVVELVRAERRSVGCDEGFPARCSWPITP
jgi:hypothetical protein